MRHTVDGRNPKQPPGMYKIPGNHGIKWDKLHINLCRISSINSTTHVWVHLHRTHTRTYIVVKCRLNVECMDGLRKDLGN